MRSRSSRSRARSFFRVAAPDQRPRASEGARTTPRRRRARRASPCRRRSARSLGARDALVTIVEFTDYECPYCAKAEKTIATLRESYGRDLRVAVAMHPLPMHPHARDAALVALAASPQLRETSRALVRGLGGNRRRPTRRARPFETLARAETLGSDAPRATARRRSSSTDVASAARNRTRRSTGRLARARNARGARRERRAARARVRRAARPKRARAPRRSHDDAPKVVAAARGVSGLPFLGPRRRRSDDRALHGSRVPVLQAPRRAPSRTRHEDARRRARRLPQPPAADAPARAPRREGRDRGRGAEQLAPFVEVVFAHQDALDRAALVGYAAQAGLDVARFTRDLDSERNRERARRGRSPRGHSST